MIADSDKVNKSGPITGYTLSKDKIIKKIFRYLKQEEESLTGQQRGDFIIDLYKLVGNPLPDKGGETPGKSLYDTYRRKATK